LSVYWRRTRGSDDGRISPPKKVEAEQQTKETNKQTSQTIGRTRAKEERERKIDITNKRKQTKMVIHLSLSLMPAAAAEK
jgi:hypothetical protein